MSKPAKNKLLQVVLDELEALLKPDKPYDNSWTIEDEIKYRIKYWKAEQ